jgi:hypothetical protein
MAKCNGALPHAAEASSASTRMPPRSRSAAQCQKTGCSLVETLVLAHLPLLMNNTKIHGWIGAAIKLGIAVWSVHGQ